MLDFSLLHSSGFSDSFGHSKNNLERQTALRTRLMGSSLRKTTNRLFFWSQKGRELNYFLMVALDTFQWYITTPGRGKQVITYLLFGVVIAACLKLYNLIANSTPGRGKQVIYSVLFCSLPKIIQPYY